MSILVRGGHNMAIGNLKANGYKVVLVTRGVFGPRLENCDFSYNYRQHLNNTREKEDQ